MAPLARDFLSKVLSLWGTPYIYGGKGRHGIDCSGVVTFAYHACGGPNWTLTHGTGALWDELEPVSEAEVLPAHLVFFIHPGAGATKQVDHVEVVLPFGLTIGARGGDPRCTTALEAARRSACVKLGEWNKPVAYRRVVGFRKLPLDYSTAGLG